MKKCLLAFAVLTAMSSAFALELPASSVDDHRIRYVTYNRNDVVQLDTVVGVATHIEIEPGEEYVTHVFGDSQAYAFTRAQNHIFIKPTVADSSTNLTLVTSRRVYNFNLTYVAEDTKKQAVYDLSFRYPDTVAKQIAEQKKKADLETAFKEPRGKTNLKYAMSGDFDVAPIHAWDIGTITYFKFPDNVDMPNIYTVDAHGNESIVPRNIVGPAKNIVAVHKVNPVWTIRLGDSALRVWNDGFDPKGLENVSRTASPAVKRVVRGLEDE